jgi:hypothetical protein
MANLVLVSPSKQRLRSPVGDLHSCWIECSEKEKDSFDFGPWETDIAEFLTMMMNSGRCMDLHNASRETKCMCMEELRDHITEEEKDRVVAYLIIYARMAFREQRSLVAEWKRYAASSRMMGGHRTDQHKVFLLPGSHTHKICKNAIARIIGKKKVAWNSIGRKEDSHGLADRPSNHSTRQEDIDLLHDYFFSLNALGSPRATRIVTTLTADKVATELKDVDTDLVELPSCHSKRSLYNSYLVEVGWHCNYDNKSRVTSLVELPDSERKTTTPVSWPTFCRYWKNNFPKLVIQKPSEDICDDCVVFANRHKYIGKKRQELKEEANENGGAMDYDQDNNDLDEQEELVEKAAHHVMMAKKQREFFNSKKELAKSTAHLPQEDRVFTFVADFAQNMYIPNFAAQQPGATYYYSPLNVYPFGIVDGSTDPTQLTAHVFYEGEAKKGGNSVASMLWKELETKGLINGRCAKEINFVFDNCAGQNKNRMVTRFLFFLVKLGITKIARAIFLVKGHTKNDCDRMFNLMKYDYRKMNCYTPADLISIVNQHPQVNAVAMKPSDFHDWDALENKMIKKAEEILKNHVFAVMATSPNTILIQEYAGAPVNRQHLVKKQYEAVDWKPHFKLQVLPPLGLPDIKWNELYVKWGRFIPEDKKSGLIYYMEKPPDSVKQKIAEQSAEAKKAREKRSRSGDHGEKKVAAVAATKEKEPASKKPKISRKRSANK